ncbi:hypothetical protein L3X38_003040 [Prunus dulcis]|uniref:Uncharacterized protein n=1 Tax=Prunus dulcis TaxID=3755 RepID=A0AAD4WYC7_PRUDU|nr:hypothetical protein L3X38_003040 [Prunus dulcis]
MGCTDSVFGIWGRRFPFGLAPCESHQGDFCIGSIEGCVDLGEKNYKCIYCGALFWLKESIQQQEEAFSCNKR